MKKSISLFLMPFLFLVPADAQAQEECPSVQCCYEDACCVDEANFYVKVYSGANFLQNIAIDRNDSTYQTGYIIEGNLGYRWNCGLRVEGEYAYRRNAIRHIHFFGQGSSQHGHFQTSSYMANILWDFSLISLGEVFCNIQPFFGAGVGYDVQKMHSSTSRITFNQKWDHLSWQLMAGLAYPIFCNANISLEYMFHQGGCHFYNHSIGIGLTYQFCSKSFAR